MKTIEFDDRTVEALLAKAHALGMSPQELIVASVGIESNGAGPSSADDFDASLDAALAGVEGNAAVSAAALRRADFYEDEE